MTSRLEKLYSKLEAVSLLRLAKGFFTYRELSKITGLHEMVIARYVNGHSLPLPERARDIRDVILKSLTLDMFSKKLLTDDGTIKRSVIGKAEFTDLIVSDMLQTYGGRKINNVLAMGEYAIPTGGVFVNKIRQKLTIATPYRKAMTDIEAVYNEGPIVSQVYIPEKTIARNEDVLLLTDVVITGERECAVAGLVYRQGANPIGLYTIESVGEEWKRTFQEEIGQNFNVNVFLSPSRKFFR